jgi:hypothetical protein
VARPKSDEAVVELVAKLNADKQFAVAFGRKVTADDVQTGMKSVGRFKSS